MKGCSSESERSLAQPGGAFLHGLCRLKGSCSEGESVQFDENTIWTAGEENPGHQNPGPIHKTPILRGQNGRLTDEVNDLRLCWGDSLVNRLSARCAAIIDVEALRGGNTSRGAGSVSMRLSMSLHHSLSLAFAAELAVLLRLFTFPGPRASTKRTLPRGSTLFAGAGTVSSGAEGASAPTSMAKAGAQTEWADVCL